MSLAVAFTVKSKLCFTSFVKLIIILRESQSFLPVVSSQAHVYDGEIAVVVPGSTKLKSIFFKSTASENVTSKVFPSIRLKIGSSTLGGVPSEKKEYFIIPVPLPPGCNVIGLLCFSSYV